MRVMGIVSHAPGLEPQPVDDREGQVSGDLIEDGASADRAVARIVSNEAELDGRDSGEACCHEPRRSALRAPGDEQQCQEQGEEQADAPEVGPCGSIEQVSGPGALADLVEDLPRSRATHGPGRHAGAKI